MSKNIDQVYIANPITSNASTDLIYIGQSPYGVGNDAAITYSNFAAQFGTPYTASALTRTNDTNVTLTLGGTPSTALLQSVSITAGWSGTLSGTRGGTGVNNGSNTATYAGNLNFANSFTTSGNFAVTQTYTNTTNVTFPTSGTLATTSQIPTGAALTKTDDTNVTLTLGGSPTTALVNAASITAGWSGQLGVARGGTGTNTFTAYSVVCAGTTSTGAFQNVSGLGSSGQVLTSNGAGLLPTWQAVPASGPWSAGAGTNSAIGGDGTCTAAGNYSLCYGNNSSAAAGNNNYLFGSNNSTVTNANDVFMSGNNNSVTSAVSNNFILGNNNTTNSANCVMIGNFNQSTHGNGVMVGFSCTTHASNTMASGNVAVATNAGSYVWSDQNGSGNTDTAANQYVITAAGGFLYYQNSTLITKIDSNGNLINFKGTADQSYSLQAPSTGFSITIADGSKTLILHPSGTLASGTITMPANPIDGQEVRIASNQIVTSLTVSANAGQTISNAPTTIAAGTGFAYIYNLSGTNWYRLY